MEGDIFGKCTHRFILGQLKENTYKQTDDGHDSNRINSYLYEEGKKVKDIFIMCPLEQKGQLVTHHFGAVLISRWGRAEWSKLQR